MQGELAINLMDRPGQELERRTVAAADGSRLAYAEAGRGPPVVLIHGTLTALEDMALSLFEALAPAFRVVAFDRPGFGRSEVRRFVDAGVWRQGARLHDAIVRLGLERPVLVGHSFGASVAVAMAVARPEAVAGVVALAPLVLPEARLEHLLFGPRAVPVTGDLLGLGSSLTGDRALLPILWRAMFLPQPMPRRVLEAFPFALAGRTESSLRTGEDSFAAMPDLMRTLEACARCPAPVRVLGGDRDLVVRNGTNGRLLAALMPNGTYGELPGLGHMIHHFAQEEIVRAVRDLSAERG